MQGSNWYVPKHRGLTLLWLPLDQPGLDIRPIHQVTGGSEFTEVFLDGALVADASRIGDGTPAVGRQVAAAHLVPVTLERVS